MKHGEGNDNKIKFKGTAGETPRVIDGNNQSAIEKGTGEDYKDLADEKYFKNYWHILPSDMYDPCNIMEQVYNQTQDNSIGIHGSKLKDEAGTQDTEKLRAKAESLRSAAESLETALNSNQDAKGKVTKLKEAASNPGVSPKGLKELLKDLSSAPDFLQIFAKAQLVQKQCETVEREYKEVAADSTSKGQTPQFNQVTTAFNALNTELKGQLNNISLIYNSRETSATGLTAKATDIQSKAGILSSTAESQSTTELTNTKAVDIQGTTAPEELKTKANSLKSAAEKLHDAAETLAQEAAKPQSQLNPLQSPATKLKDTAKKDDGYKGLYWAANALATHSGTDNLEPKANDVIQKFEAVKSAYNELMKAATKLTDLPEDQQQKVKAVEKEYNALKDVYDGMLNLTKIAYYAGKIQAASGASLDELKGAAGTLATNVTTLRNGTDDDANANAETVKSQFETVKEQFYKLDGENKKKVQIQFQAMIGVYNHIGSSAGETSSQGTLRLLAEELYKKANALNTAVTTVSNAEAAKVLRYKAGTDAEKDNPKYLRKLAAELHAKAKELANKAPAKGDSSDDASFQQKAGTSPDDGLRGLAAKLYKEAKALKDAVSQDSGVDDGEAANDLANAVGANETSGDKLRNALAQLAEATDDLTDKAGVVKQQYGTVQQRFGEVEKQNILGKYSPTQGKPEYDKVKKAWTAFQALYNADLKLLATELKDAIGDGKSDKLQGTLAALGNLPENTELLGPAGAVKDAYDKGSGGEGVKPKFDTLQLKESLYQAIASIKSLYQPVETAMNAFDNVYRPEELLMNAVGDGPSEGSGLQKVLANLGNDKRDEPDDLPALAQGVKDKYDKFDGSGVKQKFHLVQDQADAYAVGSKTGEYAQLLEAWRNFNDKYYKAISYYKYHSIVIPSIFSMRLECSPKTKFVGPGFGGWKQYTDGSTPVYGWIWHLFDILMVIKISLAGAVLWTIAYWEGDGAKDDFPASASSPTQLTYSIEQNFGPDSHAKDSCGHKKSPEYYANMMSPSLMVLIGIGIPLPNLTIVTTVSFFVNIVEFLFIVLDNCKSNVAGESITTIIEVEG